MPDDADDFDRFWDKDRERRKNPEERSRIDALRSEYQALATRNWTAIQEIHHGYDRFTRKAKRLLVLLLAAQFATGFGVIKAISDNSGETGARIAAIQMQRRQSVLNNCQGQSARHDATILQLDRGLVRAAGGQPDPRSTDAQLVVQFAALAVRRPARTVELRQSREFTILLIDALAPKQDCQAAVKSALSGRPRTAIH